MKVVQLEIAEKYPILGRPNFKNMSLFHRTKNNDKPLIRQIIDLIPPVAIPVPPAPPGFIFTPQLIVTLDGHLITGAVLTFTVRGLHSFCIISTCICCAICACNAPFIGTAKSAC